MWQRRSRATRSVADAGRRIDVGLLDKLMNLVGELVLVRNQILQVQQARGRRGSSRPRSG
ncbi:MAG: hypothetical protein U0992_07755 [Planctomycetaceae bacterium]